VWGIAPASVFPAPVALALVKISKSITNLAVALSLNGCYLTVLFRVKINLLAADTHSAILPSISRFNSRSSNETSEVTIVYPMPVARQNDSSDVV
jgi:hypothetical protein